jgi:aspartyl protease family protein
MRFMIGDVTKSAVGLVVSGLVLFFLVENRLAIYDAVGLTSPSSAPRTETVAIATPRVDTKPIVTGGSITLKKNPRDGQFWTDARINNKKINLLVDTGASAVALTLEDAKRAGVRVRQLDYNIPVNTAGGQVMAARTTLKSVKVGPIKVRDVRAVVIPEGLHVSLLGMTYLGEVRKIEVSSDKMVLKN